LWSSFGKGVLQFKPVENYAWQVCIGEFLKGTYIFLGRIVKAYDNPFLIAVLSK